MSSTTLPAPVSGSLQLADPPPPNPHATRSQPLKRGEMSAYHEAMAEVDAEVERRARAPEDSPVWRPYCRRLHSARVNVFATVDAEPDKSSRKERARQIMQAVLQDKSVRLCHLHMIGIGLGLARAGLSRESRSVYQLALSIALRHHFVAITGRHNCEILPPEEHATRLRSTTSLDSATFKILAAILREKPPYDAAYLQRLQWIAQEVHDWTYGD